MSDTENEKKPFFERVDLVCAKIKEVSRHPDADKLYVLELDDGSETGRVIVSGLVPFYTIEELTGKTIVVIGNLKPAKFKGIKSDGMLLASHDDLIEATGKDSCEVLFVDGEPGDRLSDKSDVISHKMPFVTKRISAESFSHLTISTVEHFVMIDKKDFVYLNGKKIELKTANGLVG